MITIKYKKVNPEAFDPEFANPTDVGFDIKTPVSFAVDPGKTYLASTGLAFDIPDHCELQIRPKSGLAVRGITVLNTPGTVDPLYKKEVKVILFNVGPDPIYFEKGNKICQGVVKERTFITFEQVTEDIDTTGRGGFGSTGI